MNIDVPLKDLGAVDIGPLRDSILNQEDAAWHEDKFRQQVYDVHRERPFFGSLTDFMSSGPCVVMALQGKGAISKLREAMGATNPADAADGTIRKDLASDIEHNIVHGSDAPETASYEINYFFNALEDIFDGPDDPNDLRPGLQELYHWLALTWQVGLKLDLRIILGFGVVEIRLERCLGLPAEARIGVEERDARDPEGPQHVQYPVNPTVIVDVGPKQPAARFVANVRRYE